jgi:O-antigen ligase
VHSIELEMASDLGIVGLLAFFAFAGGVAWAGWRAMRVRPELAAGSVAALSAWLLHASIDWDWQLPAVTLPAIVMAGLLIAVSELSPPPPGRAA